MDWTLKASNASRQQQANNSTSRLRHEFSLLNSNRSLTRTLAEPLKDKLTQKAQMRPLIVFVKGSGSEVRRVEARPRLQYNNMYETKLSPYNLDFQQLCRRDYLEGQCNVLVPPASLGSHQVVSEPSMEQSLDVELPSQQSEVEVPGIEYVDDWEREDTAESIDLVKHPTLVVISGLSQRKSSSRSPENVYGYVRGGSIGRGHSAAEGRVDKSLKTPKLRSRTGTAIEPNFLELFDSLE